MTQDEIIEMVREVQKDCVVSEDGYRIWSYESLGRLIKLAAAKEREACAKLVEPTEEHRREAQYYNGDEEGVEMLDSLATHIRARGQA
jgi:hypothetical protein